MTFSDTFSLSLRNLRQSKLRTALTTLGVSIGIASLTGMVSLGVGLQNQIVGRIMQSGVFDAITVTGAPQFFGRGGLRGRGGRRGPDAADAGERPAPLRLDDTALQQISALTHVQEAYPELRVALEMTLSDVSQMVSARGVPMSSRDQGAFQTLSYGTFFDTGSEPQCMLSLDMARQMASANEGSLIGKALKLSYAASTRGSSPADPLAGVQIRRMELDCPIVGIVESDPGGQILGAAGVSGLMIPLELAKTINAEIVTNVQQALAQDAPQRVYNAISVRVDDPQFTQDVEDGVRRLGYSVFSVSDALRGAKNAFIVLDVLLSLIGSIALTVSALGIVNTMVMSILERTREIGVMKAIGAGNSDIRRIFLIEASAIGVLGGMLGITLGWIVGQLINFGANLYIRSQGGTPVALFSLPLWLMAAAIVFSILVSLLAGSYPASRAARLDPIRALRHD